MMKKALSFREEIPSRVLDDLFKKYAYKNSFLPISLYDIPIRKIIIAAE